MTEPVTPDTYARFELTRPGHVGEAHWTSIEVEIIRRARALDEGIDAQVSTVLRLTGGALRPLHAAAEDVGGAAICLVLPCRVDAERGRAAAAVT